MVGDCYKAAQILERTNEAYFLAAKLQKRTLILAG
jgi:hypothetical protein